MLRIQFYVSALFALGFALGCDGDSGSSEDSGRDPSSLQSALVQFDSCDELESYLEQIALEEMERLANGEYYGGYGYPEGPWLDGFVGGPTRGDDDLADGGSDDGPPTPSGPGEGDDGGGENYTDTNTQEKGVDEADIVKTDGEYLYILSGGKLYIAQATPPENAEIVAGMEMEGNPIEMFLHEGQAIVFSALGGWGYYYGGPMPATGGPDIAFDADFVEEDREAADGVGKVASASVMPYPGDWSPPKVKATLLDVSNPAAPMIVRQTVFDGNYQSSRRVGDKMHLVLNSYLQGPELEYYPTIDLPYPETEDCWRIVDELIGDGGVCYGDDVGGEPDRDGDSTGGSGGVDPMPPDEYCERNWEEIYNDPEYKACEERNRQKHEEYQEEYNRLYQEALEPMIQRNKEKIAQATLADWLPSMSDDATGEGFLAECGRFYRPDLSSGRGVISVLTLDLFQQGTPYVGSAVVSNPGVVYASGSSLYLAAYFYDYWMWMHDFNEPPQEATRIHKFDLTGDFAQYVASGEVPGQTLNQFSLSEHNGDLRIATHTNAVWDGDDDIDVGRPTGGGDVADGVGSDSPPAVDATDVVGRSAAALVEADWDESRQANHIWVLREEGETLDIIGQITGIAPDERIYSARFMGDKGFLVTFLQIDPLFTLDLSDPTDPQIVGELKVPGFSTYLHDLGDDRLLAIGEAIDEDGMRRLGLQLQIFDVSDFADPQMAHRLIIGEAYSEAEYNHKAFTYFAQQGVLAIPVNSWNGESFNGTKVYDIDPLGGISERGGVDHSVFMEGAAYYWTPTVVRNVIIDSALYSISDLGVLANDLSDLNQPLSISPFDLPKWIVDDCNYQPGGCNPPPTEICDPALVDGGVYAIADLMGGQVTQPAGAGSLVPMLLEEIGAGEDLIPPILIQLSDYDAGAARFNDVRAALGVYGADGVALDPESAIYDAGSADASANPMFSLETGGIAIDIPEIGEGGLVLDTVAVEGYFSDCPDGLTNVTVRIRMDPAGIEALAGEMIDGLLDGQGICESDLLGGLVPGLCDEEGFIVLEVSELRGERLKDVALEN